MSFPFQLVFPGISTRGSQGIQKFLPSTVDLLVLSSLDQLLLILKTFLLFSKTSFINEEVKCTELSLSVSVPYHLNLRLLGHTKCPHCCTFRGQCYKTIPW
jgi:hypothetical protein